MKLHDGTGEGEEHGIIEAEKLPLVSVSMDYRFNDSCNCNAAMKKRKEGEGEKKKRKNTREANFRSGTEGEKLNPRPYIIYI